MKKKLTKTQLKHLIDAELDMCADALAMSLVAGPERKRWITRQKAVRSLDSALF